MWRFILVWNVWKPFQEAKTILLEVLPGNHRICENGCLECVVCLSPSSGLVKVMGFIHHQFAYIKKCFPIARKDRLCALFWWLESSTTIAAENAFSPCHLHTHPQWYWMVHVAGEKGNGVPTSQWGGRHRSKWQGRPRDKRWEPLAMAATPQGMQGMAQPCPAKQVLRPLLNCAMEGQAPAQNVCCEWIITFFAGKWNVIKVPIVLRRCVLHIKNKFKSCSIFETNKL